MRTERGHIAYLDAADITSAEREILKGFIDQRNAITPTGPRTKGKQAYEGTWICREIRPATLDKATVKDLLRVASKASGGTFTKDTRQTKITTLKALARYIDRFHHPIKNIDLLIQDIKAGSPAKNRKTAITVAQWDRLRALPMSAKARAELYLLYDGYHRPGELALLNWSHLKQDPETGEIEYQITFKTEKTRTIVMRAAAVEVLEKWRQECGALLTDDTPIFPAPNGGRYQTITHLSDLFSKLKKQAGIPNLTPSLLRNSGPQHDLEAGYPVAYVCLRMWGEPYNELINLYTKPDSGRIQRDQHGKAGERAAAVIGKEREYRTQADKIADLERQMKIVMRAAERKLSED